MIFPTRIPPSAPLAFVLDVSVAAAWGVPPRYSVYAHRVRFRLVTGTPALLATNWPLDLADEFHTAVGRGETTMQRADGALAVLSTYQLYLDSEGPSRAWPEVLNLARAHGLPVRDAAHLELALRMNLPLATIDPSLTGAAHTTGVPIFTP